MIEVGQVYQENDPRFIRMVRVLAIKRGFVQIENVETERKTWSRKDRFGSDARGKYSLVSVGGSNQ